jgi:hypothetical protein
MWACPPTPPSDPWWPQGARTTELRQPGEPPWQTVPFRLRPRNFDGALALSAAFSMILCIGYHVQAPRQLGVAQELNARRLVSWLYGGGPALMYAATAIAVSDEFFAQPSNHRVPEAAIEPLTARSPRARLAGGSPRTDAAGRENGGTRDQVLKPLSCNKAAPARRT